MPYRDVDAARAARDRETAPVVFRLAGHDYRCVAHPLFADVMDLLDAPDPDMDPEKIAGNEAVAARALALFIRRLLVSNRDRKRFDRVLADREKRITAREIIDLGEWLGREYSGRPTPPPSDSSDGRQNDGESSIPSPSAPAMRDSRV